MKNEVAAVVGVGPGLGAALVKRFANEGFTTIAVARRASSWTSLRGGDGPVILYDCDATVPEQVELLFQKIQSDCWAGVGQTTSLSQRRYAGPQFAFS